MMQLFMSAALLVLAGARVPALRRKGKDPVFLAAGFAALASLLLSPLAYPAVDAALGGFNLTRLALNSFMIVGLWHLRSAILHAVSRDADPRPAWLRRLPLTLTLALQTAFFILTGPTSTTLLWSRFHDRLPGALFALMLVLFVIWSCGEIAWTCFRFVPRMRRAFKAGFIMVGTGALIAIIVMLDMAREVLLTYFPALDSPGLSAFPIPLAEMVAVILVGVGLTIPALAGRHERRVAADRLARTVQKVAVIREKALSGTDLERVLKTEERASAQERLHRMVVEIWDAELASGPDDTALTSEDRAYVLRVESEFDMEKTH